MAKKKIQKPTPEEEQRVRHRLELKYPKAYPGGGASSTKVSPRATAENSAALRRDQITRTVAPGFQRLTDVLQKTKPKRGR